MRQLPAFQRQMAPNGRVSHQRRAALEAYLPLASIPAGCLSCLNSRLADGSHARHVNLAGDARRRDGIDDKFIL